MEQNNEHGGKFVRLIDTRPGSYLRLWWMINCAILSKLLPPCDLFTYLQFNRFILDISEFPFSLPFCKSVKGRVSFSLV